MRPGFTSALCAGALFAVAALGCEGVQCDLHARAQELALSEDAEDCGDVEGWLESAWTDAESAQICVLAALSEGLPFFASTEPATSDGGTNIGWASDGTRFYRLRHDYVLPMFGSANEEFRAHECAEIVEDPDCVDLLGDLCLECVEPMRVSRSCD